MGDHGYGKGCRDPLRRTDQGGDALPRDRRDQGDDVMITPEPPFGKGLMRGLGSNGEA